METYLGDALKSTVFTNKKHVINAAKNLDEFKKRKFELKDFVSDQDFVEKIVLKQLCRYLYHDVVKVMKIYKQTLDFSCSYNLREMIKITKVRHDLVHRNGKDNDGHRVALDLNTLNISINEIESFIKYLDDNLECST